MQAGEEMLRSKKRANGTYDENSYSSPDSVNNIKWDLLKDGTPEYQTMQYYKGLISFRKSCETLRLANAYADEDETELIVSEVKSEGAFVAIQMVNPDSGEKLLIVYNAELEDKTFTLPEGNWNLYIDGDRAGDTVLQANCTGDVTVSKISCYVYKAA